MSPKRRVLSSRFFIGAVAAMSVLVACSSESGDAKSPGAASAGGGLERSVYVNEGDGFTIQSAHVVTVAEIGPPNNRSETVVRKEMFVEDFGEKVGIIETRTTQEYNPNEREERVMLTKTYIADGKQHTETTRQRRIIDGEIIDPGITEPVVTEDFDPIWDSVASKLMLTGSEKAPVGYSDGGSKKVASAACKLWMRDAPRGEDCVWHGFDLYSGTISEDSGAMIDVLTTERLELDAAIPEDLVRLSR